MASRHPHCHCSPTAAAASAAASNNGCYCGCYCTSSHQPPPDSLFMHHPTFQQPLSSSCPYASTQQSLHPHRPARYPPPQTEYQKERYCQEFRQFHPDGGLSQSHPTVASLLRRIAALESALHSHASSRSYSLRDAAARIIQSHFRAFLVRRSRTLRQLKELASIKSALNVLKSAISEDSCFYPRLLTKETSNLLRRLDSIQGDDSMIRDGKTSVVKELTHFMDSIDSFCQKRSELSSRVVKKNRKPMKETNKPRVLNPDYDLERTNHGDAESKRVQDVTKRIDALYDKVQGFGEDDEEDENLDSTAIYRLRSMNLTNRHNNDQDKTKKKVSFAEKGYVYSIPSRHFQHSMGDNSDDRHDPNTSNSMLEDDMGWEAVEVTAAPLDDEGKDDETRSDDEVSCESSDDGERNPGVSAQLPVRMEPRPDYMEKKSSVKRVEQRP